MPKGLKETSNAMKKGRAYKNIHAILKKYPRKRFFFILGYPQTSVKASQEFINNMLLKDQLPVIEMLFIKLLNYEKASVQ